MSQSYRELADGLPARKRPGPDSFPADPRRASAWVATLPRANPVATTEMLEKALSSLRESSLEGGQRLAVLEVLRPMLRDVMSGMHRQCQGSAIPLPLPKARVFDRLQRLESELALGYRLALVEYCAPAGSVPFLRGGNVALALQRAVLHTARCLDHAYFIYRQPPSGVWLQLHRLFGFALAVKLQDKAVAEPALGRPLSAGAIYAHALLLAVSNPYRFSQRDQLQLAELGPELGRFLDIASQRSNPDQLAVPLGVDRGPGYLASEREEDEEARLWLDVAPLRARIEQWLSEGVDGSVRFKRSDGRMQEVPADLLCRLRDGWGRRQARQTQRLAARHRLDTAIGLSGLHFHLAGLVDFDTFLRQAGQGEEANAESRQQRAVWAHAAVDAGRIPLQSAEVVDQSLGGYQLRWPAEEAVKARVDELIGLSVAADGEERQWLLGVIRWLRYDAEGAVDAGIQLLSRRVRPVALRLVEAEDEARSPLRGIEYQPVNAVANGTLHFSAAGAMTSMGSQIEVLRVPDINDLDEPVALREVAAAPSVAENAGDYVLLVAHRKDSAA